MIVPNPLRIWGDTELEDYPPGKVLRTMVDGEIYYYLHIFKKPINREIEGILQA
jgi:hypothetical protein